MKVDRSVLDLLNEVADFLDNYADTEDRADGSPQANPAMMLLMDVEAEIERQKKLVK